jgi:hypothetical protein
MLVSSLTQSQSNYVGLVAIMDITGIFVLIDISMNSVPSGLISWVEKTCTRTITVNVAENMAIPIFTNSGTVRK